MAKIEDLVSQIPDERLRKAIANEVKELKKTKKFGLVFEEHLPETVRLPSLPVKVGELVAKKKERGNDLWRVQELSKGIATLVKDVEGYSTPPTEKDKVKVDELVVVRRFGEPIYPALTPIDRVARGGEEKPWHVLINADNFHALQLLLYCYEKQVDVIYIDPPYNSGARDWKYNNDYVDKTDTFRHSKWLSMMKKRLVLAKRLLSPNGSLVVTIDENELNHLGVLLEEIFPDRLRHMVTIVINPKGAGKKNFGRTEEHALFVIPNSSEPPITANFILDLNRIGISSEMAEEEDDEDVEEGDDDQSDQKAGDFDIEDLPFPIEELSQWELRHARRRGNESSYRHQRKNQFYPIYINEKKGTVEEIGESIPLEEQPDYTPRNGLIPIWPIDKEGNERCWRFIPSSMRCIMEEERLVVGRKDSTTGTYTLNIWEPKTKYKKVKTVWWSSRHDAGSHGTSLLHKILGRRAAFPFPKSLYAVRDTLLTAIARNPNALVLDFFAGSGTTLHATALINAQLGGNRRCILVSNNEPGEKDAKRLIRQGILPGDEKFEAAGICESVTWPRCKYVLNGKRDNGVKLPGLYLDIEGHPKQLRQSDGFRENMEYFRLEFLDPDAVARGDAFKAVLPILWLMAGAFGEREASKGSSTWYLPKNSPFAVLLKEKEFASFKKSLHERDDVHWVFLVTDSEESFGQMRRALGKRYPCAQLYKSYLENFRINAPETLQH